MSSVEKNLLKITAYSNISTAILLTIMNFFEPAITETNPVLFRDFK